MLRSASLSPPTDTICRYCDALLHVGAQRLSGPPANPQTGNSRILENLGFPFASRPLPPTCRAGGRLHRRSPVAPPATLSRRPHGLTLHRHSDLSPQLSYLLETSIPPSMVYPLRPSPCKIESPALALFCTYCGTRAATPPSACCTLSASTVRWASQLQSL
jgi:hypothetical protein